MADRKRNLPYYTRGTQPRETPGKYLLGPSVGVKSGATRPTGANVAALSGPVLSPNRIASARLEPKTFFGPELGLTAIVWRVNSGFGASPSKPLAFLLRRLRGPVVAEHVNPAHGVSSCSH